MTPPQEIIRRTSDKGVLLITNSLSYRQEEAFSFVSNLRPQLLGLCLWRKVSNIFFSDWYLLNSCCCSRNIVHCRRNGSNLFQITEEAHPGVSGVSKDQKFCEELKSIHCQVDHPAKLSKIKNH